MTQPPKQAEPRVCVHEYDSLSFKEETIGIITTECTKCRAKLTAVWLDDQSLKERDELKAKLERAKYVIRSHHAWQVAIGSVTCYDEDGKPIEGMNPIDLSTEYNESHMCEATLKILKELGDE